MSNKIRRRAFKINKERDRIRLRRLRALGLITGNSLAKIEDSKNLSSLGRVAAYGTLFAHKKAKEISDEMIFVRDGKVIRQVKGKKPQILEQLSTRKAKKGDILYLQNS
ncbi:hypothetical protein [Flavivirga rizhaonensis]|uniref:Uncharacterized protein n=1 Tax=Flavivirga rizhaonensis TaxID=2559571 RepID=A0A4S1DZP2_9FLAO|nr:hypothetical protein [Flavivirga rizhaonensis]TGV03495.1 hypothetical protein EM932_05540 [Flavivirga rizhaonensis]